jgi:hypothetical protein
MFNFTKNSFKSCNLIHLNNGILKILLSLTITILFIAFPNEKQKNKNIINKQKSVQKIM